MERRARTWRRVFWNIGAVVASVLLVFAAVQAISAVEIQHRLARRLAEPPLRLAVDLSRPGIYAADWQVPYYGENGTEFELRVTPAYGDPAALVHSLAGFSGSVCFYRSPVIQGAHLVTASDFREFSQDRVRHNGVRGAFLWVVGLKSWEADRLTLAVLHPAPAVAGLKQVLLARPVMDPVSTLWPMYLCWGLAGVSFVIGAVMALVLVWAGVRWHRQAGRAPS